MNNFCRAVLGFIAALPGVCALKYTLGESFLYPLSKLTGWDLDLETELENLQSPSTSVNLPNVVIINTKYDHYFPEGVGLGSSQNLKKWCSIYNFVMPRQFLHAFSAHNAGLNFYQLVDLEKGRSIEQNNLFRENESMADYLIRISDQ